MAYSKRQKEIISWLEAMSQRGIKTTSLDHLVTVLQQVDRDRKWTRNGIAAIMRDLERKLPLDGCVLKSNLARGKGNKLEFTFMGNFKQLLEEEPA